ncbi:MAG: hypothetical protein J6U54_00010, partial [Clostridiales bacterium]|nr:hypothetical protein [Clostridiales bacterium]
MKGRLLKILSAVITVPILATSMIFATDVQAAGKTYSGTKTSDLGTRDKIKNEGVYFEPSADGKYPVMIYFHGASQYTSNDDLGNLPDRLLNDMNKWIDKGYCDPMVVITPRITKTADWGIGDFKKYFKREDNTKSDFDILLEQILSGSGIGEKIDTSKPIIVAGYSMGASAALYAGTLHPEIFYNVGAFSPSYCYYREDGWIQDASEIVFSQDPNGHFMLSYGIGEGTGYFDENVRRYIDTANNNGKNIKDRFKKRVYISDTGPHGWACVFETGTFEYLYYLKYDVLPDEETTVNAVFGIVTIEGTTTVGNTLTASLMSYYGVENYCGYQWYREDPSTGAFNAISGATSKTYTLSSADAGCRIRCKIVDTREKPPQGNGKSGYSFATTAVISSSQTPSPKAITGTVSLSSTSPCYGISVQAIPKNSNATSFKYQWMRGDSAISGATSDWYAITK